MTYDTQGRRVLQGHPSRWEDECKALWIAATTALHKLEQSRFSNSEHEQAKDILRKATTAPQSATHSAKSEQSDPA